MYDRIPTAFEMKDNVNERHRIGLEKAVESVVRAIKKASEQGLTETTFCPPAYWYKTEIGTDAFISFYSEVKEIFLRKGYKFKPTGFIGGVWQKTENICWH